MPKGLAKMRYEQEAHRWSQGAINKLRLKGINLIKDAMPFGRFKQYLKSVDTPALLLDVSMDLLDTLKSFGDLPSGFVHGTSEKQTKDILEGKGTMRQALNAAASASSSTSPTKGQTTINKSLLAVSFNDDINENDVDNARDRGSTPTLEDKHTTTTTTGAAGGGSDEELEDPTLPSRVLVSMVEGGKWADLRSSSDDLLMHAAFIVCPHVSKKRAPDGSWLEVTSAMGHAAFKAHTKSVQRMSREDAREAVRAR